MGIDKLSWKSRVTIMITAFALALSVGMAFGQGQTADLKLVRTEADITSACSYYELYPTPPTLTDDLAKLKVIRLNEVRGHARDIRIEVLTEAQHETDSQECVTDCKDIYDTDCSTTCESIPGTPYITEEWVSIWDWDVKDGNKVLDAGAITRNADGFEAYLADKSKLMVRICGSYDVGKTASGWGVSIDHIPEFKDKEYPLYDWWNVTYTNRKPVDINVSNGVTLTDFQVLLNVTYDSDMNADFSDLRFTNNCSTDATALDYCLGADCGKRRWTQVNSAWADVWVKVPTVNSTICMYYGYTAATTTSDPFNTFVAYADWDNCTVGDSPGCQSWSETNCASAQECEVAEKSSNNVMWEHVQGNVGHWGNTFNAPYVYIGTTETDNMIFEGWIYYNQSASGIGHVFMRQDTNDWIKNGQGYSSGADYIQFAWDVAGTSNGITPSVALNPGWLRVIRNDTAEWFGEYDSDGLGAWTYVGSFSQSWTINDFGFGAYQNVVGVGDFFFDELTARKYSPVDPAATYGSEESASSDSVSVSLDTPGDSSYHTVNAVTFGFTPTTNGTLQTCELWGNWSGSWALNYTNSSVNNGSVTYTDIAGIPDGTFKWGAFCNTTLGYSAWSGNYTLTVNTAPPTIAVDSPLNQTYQTLPIPLNVTVSENAITCLYNINSGANSTMSNSSGTNWYSSITGLTTGNLYNLTVWCNDTDGFHGTNSTLWFTYDSILEIRVFEESSPTTPVNGFSINITGDTGTLNYVSTSWYYEISVSDLDPGANTIRISNSSYYDRYYYINITPTYNGSITAYLIPINESLVNPTFVVKNILDNPVADVLLTFQRLINGSYVTVAQRLTDDTGLTTVNLISGDSYRIQITYGSLTQYYTFTAADQEYLIILDETLEVDFTQPFAEIYVAVSPQTISYNASLSTYNVTFSYTVYSNLTSITLYGFRLLCDGSQVVETNITSSGSTGGTLSTDYNVTLCSNMTLEYYFITSEFWGRSITYQIYQNQPYGLYEAVERAKGQFNSAQLNFLAVIILMLVAAGLSWLSPEGGALAGIIMGGIFAWFQILELNLFIITAITLFSIMFIRRRWL